MSVMFVDMGAGDSIVVDGITIMFESRKGGKGRLRVEADKSIKIDILKSCCMSGNDSEPERMSAINHNGNNSWLKQ